MWQIKYNDRARKNMRKLGNAAQSRIVKTVREKLKSEPLVFGKRLTGELSDYYSLRAGAYRIIYSIDEQNKLVTVINVGNRDTIYAQAKRIVTSFFF